MMPSVGMRRSTKVLVVKGGEGARVLRSGRRLWPDSDGGRLRRNSADGVGGGEWLDMIRTSHDGQDGASNCKSNGWHHHHRPYSNKQDDVVAPMDVDSKSKSPEPLTINVESKSSEEKMWGCVYQRKRKRLHEKSSDNSRNLNKYRKKNSEDKRYGEYYMRRRRTKATTIIVEQSRVVVLAAAVDPSCSETSFVRFLVSVLGYLMRVRMRIRELSALLLTGSVHEVFSSHGIHFSRVPCSSGPGICKFFGVIRSVPLFSVDFSAVPSCFLYMQLDMLLRSRCLQSIGMESKTDMDTDVDEDIDESLSCISSGQDLCGSKSLESGKVDPGKGRVLRSTCSAPKLVARIAQRKNSLNSFDIQTKRRSMRLRRVRNSSSFSLHKANGSLLKVNGDLVSSIFRTRSDGSQLSSVISTRRLRNSVRKSTSINIKELKSTLVGVREDIDSLCCSANLLICESDRCYREEGVNIMLKFSALKQWVLAVKKDGSVRYSHVTQNVMRPCASNRFTHATIWTGEDGWKLEFPNRGDWFIFKELYKECCDRNVQAPTNKNIPVPGVWEVSGYDDINSASFFRPDSYIVVNDDEVSRAMAKRTANYDIDSEDEEWLDKFNNDFCAEIELHEHVSAGTFELMVDALEKAQFCSPDDYSDEKAAIDLCLDLERRVVVEAVYQYWMKKRKQKRSALIRIFQCHHPRRAQLIPKSVLRKRRSFKRQASQAGIGKQRLQRLVFQAFAAEQDALEEHNAMIRVEEAKKSANCSTELAVHKRKRAQVLMDYADLAVYRATMALRIAEAAPIAETTDAAAAAYFFD